MSNHYPSAKRPTRHPIWMELAARQAARRHRQRVRATVGLVLFSCGGAVLTAAGLVIVAVTR